jgi:hypothetical protein
MKRCTALFLVFSLLFLSGNMFAQEKQGALILVSKVDGQLIKGELVAVKQNSLLLLDSNLNLDVNVDIGEIDQIEVIRKDKGAVIGGSIVGGALLGGIIAGSRESKFPEKDNPLEEAISSLYRTAETGVNAIIGIVGGILVGTLVGVGLSSNQVFMIEGSSNTEIDFILKKLHKKARIPNYK